MLYAKDFREEARSALSGRWGLAVGTGFVAALLGAYTTALNSNGGSASSICTDLLNIDYDWLPENVALILMMILFVALIIALVIPMVLAGAQFIIGGAVTLGYIKFNLDLVDGKKPQLSDLFSQFSQFGQAFLLQLLRNIFTVLWSLLFVIPGIIAVYSYAMAPYILYENPEMSGLDAITESKKLMEGNKWRLFCLDFSFIGWDILCVFTLGIGYLWLFPYREAAYAAFYRDLKQGTHRNIDVYSNQDIHTNDDYINKYNTW